MRGGERLGKTNFPGAVRLLPTKPEQAVGIEIPPILYRSFKNLQGEIPSFSVNFSLRALLDGGVSGICLKKCRKVTESGDFVAFLFFCVKRKLIFSYFHQNHMILY